MFPLLKDNVAVSQTGISFLNLTYVVHLTCYYKNKIILPNLVLCLSDKKFFREDTHFMAVIR
jgi:hypothetical protein